MDAAAKCEGGFFFVSLNLFVSTWRLGATLFVNAKRPFDIPDIPPEPSQLGTRVLRDLHTGESKGTPNAKPTLLFMPNKLEPSEYRQTLVATWSLESCKICTQVNQRPRLMPIFNANVNLNKGAVNISDASVPIGVSGLAKFARR